MHKRYTIEQGTPCFDQPCIFFYTVVLTEVWLEPLYMSLLLFELTLA